MLTSLETWVNVWVNHTNIVSTYTNSRCNDLTIFYWEISSWQNIYIPLSHNRAWHLTNRRSLLCILFIKSPYDHILWNLIIIKIIIHARKHISIGILISGASELFDAWNLSSASDLNWTISIHEYLRSSQVYVVLNIELICNELNQTLNLIIFCVWRTGVSDIVLNVDLVSFNI